MIEDNKIVSLSIEKLTEPETQVKYHQILTKKLNEKIVTVIVANQQRKSQQEKENHSRNNQIQI